MVRRLLFIKNELEARLNGWLIQRVTASVIAAYVVFLAVFLILNPAIDYYTWRGLFSNTLMSVFSSAFLLSLCWHSWMGVSGVARHYLKDSGLGLGVFFALTAIGIFYFAWGMTLIWSA